jgi:hypothetical protein
LFAVILALGVAIGACGDDDDDDDDDDAVAGDDDTTDDDDDTDDDDTDDDDSDDDDSDDDDSDDDDSDDDDATPPTDPITVYLNDFLDNSDIVGATCELVHSTSGLSYSPAMTTTSDVNGMCQFNQPLAKGSFSIKFTAIGYVDVYAFNFNAVSDWYFPMATPMTVGLIYTGLGETAVPGNGIVGGVVQWADWGVDLEEIGCATVTSNSMAPIHYLDDLGMPSSLRTSTNPNNGYYLSTNVAPGSYTFTATVDSNVETATVPAVFANALTFVNIFFETPTYAANPTPGGCVK